jgi:prevent-host-death family protein
MKRVMISELKAHLSELVAPVRRGETVIVCDRRTPVALLTPFDEEDERLHIRPPLIPMSEFTPIKPIKLPPGVSALAILEELREDRL